MHYAISGWAVLLLSIATIVEDKSAEPFDGVWVPVKASLDGEAAPEAFLKSIQLKVKGDKYEMSVDGVIEKGIMLFDQSKTPKRLKIETWEGSNRTRTAHCIYEKAGNEWTICSKQGNEYPKDLKTAKGSLLITYKRVN